MEGLVENWTYSDRSLKLNDARLSPQQRLLMLKKGCIDRINIVDFICDKVFDDQVKDAAGREGELRPAKKIPCLVEIQPQRDRQRQGSLFLRLIVGVAAYLGEKLPVEVGAFIYLHISQTTFIDQSE